MVSPKHPQTPPAEIGPEPSLWSQENQGASRPVLKTIYGDFKEEFDQRIRGGGVLTTTKTTKRPSTQKTGHARVGREMM